jgi:hypothetical protein
MIPFGIQTLHISGFYLLNYNPLLLTSRNSRIKKRLSLIAVRVCFDHGLRYSILQVIEAHYWMEFNTSAHSTKQRFYQNWYLVCLRYINDEHRYPITFFLKEICCFSLYFLDVCLKFTQKVRILQHQVSGFCWCLCVYQEPHLISRLYPRNCFSINQ